MYSIKSLNSCIILNFWYTDKYQKPLSGWQRYIWSFFKGALLWTQLSHLLFPRNLQPPRRISRRLLLMSVAVVLLLAIAAGLFLWQRELADRTDLTNRLSATREAAISVIQDNEDIYGVCPDENGMDMPCQTWFVDASVTKNGTITIVSVTGSLEQQAPNDGVVTEEVLTGTLNISHMVISQEELSENPEGTWLYNACVYKVRSMAVITVGASHNTLYHTRIKRHFARHSAGLVRQLIIFYWIETSYNCLRRNIANKDTLPPLIKRAQSLQSGRLKDYRGLDHAKMHLLSAMMASSLGSISSQLAIGRSDCNSPTSSASGHPSAWRSWPYPANFQMFLWMRYLANSRLEISNNRAERSITSFVMGQRTGCLYAGRHTIQRRVVQPIETAKENGLNPYRYLRWVLYITPRSAWQNRTRLREWHHILRQLIARFYEKQRCDPTSWWGVDCGAIHASVGLTITTKSFPRIRKLT